jgi:hypothetical protein
MARILLCIMVALASAGCELYAGTPAERRFDRTLNVSGTVNLEIRTASGGIRINTGPANTVRVVGRVRGRGWFDDDEREVKELEANPPIYQNGATIRIGDSADNKVPQRVSIGYEVTVPETTRIDAATGSGGIRIEGTQGDVHATAASGGIRLTGIHGPVVARVGSGGLSVEGMPLGAWVLRTGSGGVRVNVEDNTPFTIDARVGSGGIHSDPPVAATVSTRNRLQGTVRGGGALVQVETGSGGIQIE